MTDNPSRTCLLPQIEDAPPTGVCTTPVSIVPPYGVPDAAPRGGVQVLSFDDMMTLHRPKYLIDGLIAEQSLTILFGTSESGKTFAALDMFLSMASGLPWHGRTVLQGRGMYIVGEGTGHFSDRMRGWCQGDIQRGAAGSLRERTCFVPAAVQFLSPVNFRELQEQVRRFAKDLRLIVVDTLARCFVGGDENMAADMGLFVSRCDELRQEFNCAVLVLHHCNQRGDERGSTALGAAADTMILAKKVGDLVTLSCKKQKDDAPFEPMVFRLHVVEVARTADRKPITSCRMELVGSHAPRPHRTRSPEETHLEICAALRDCAKGTFMPADRIAAGVKLSKSTLARHLEQLIEHGCVRKRGKGKNTKYTLVKMPAGEGHDASH
jgi:predicted transcriptional regulator